MQARHLGFTCIHFGVGLDEFHMKYFKHMGSVIRQTETTLAVFITIQRHINPLLPGVAYPYPLKTSPNLYVF